MRALVALLGLLTVTWLEFQIYPGHTYLKGETQFYLPMLERLDTPGFLSRDLVATNPTFAYTIYDEVTLFLHQVAHLPFNRALAGQQLLFRFAAVAGIYLLARSLQMGIGASLVVSALANSVTLLAAPGMFVTNPEPVPSGFAFGLILLAMGWLADEKPLLGGFAAGLALLYEPLMAGTFWMLVICAMLFDRKVRWLLRPTLPVLLVFVLFLANMSQLQVGVGTVKSLGSHLSPAMAPLSRMRAPNLWPSLWAGQEIWSYLFVFIAMLWAATRIWALINQQVRWLALGMACAGIFSIALSAILLDGLHLEIAAQMPPEQLLAFAAVLAPVVCGAAAWHSFRGIRYKEAAAWTLFVSGVTLNPQVLNLPCRPKTVPEGTKASLVELADWAERDTWGSSMFLFPDAGKRDYPGIFRALSRRALWSDWQSGMIVNYSDQAGLEWWTRWQQTMQTPYAPSRLQSFLPLPVDYFVVAPEHRLQGIRSAFENRDFVAYEAQDLRNATGPLR